MAQRLDADTKTPLDPGDCPLKPGEWFVELKLLKRMRVTALDEIDAENRAVAQLRDAERDAVSDVRIAAGRYDDGKAYTPGAEWWAPMHKD